MTGVYSNLLLLSLAMYVVCMLVSLADARGGRFGALTARSGAPKVRSGSQRLTLRDRRDTSVNNGNNDNGDKKEESDRAVRKRRSMTACGPDD